MRRAHLLQQPTRVRRHRLEVSALSLGVQGPKRERRLAGSGDAREDDERVPRDVDIDALEVVLGCAADLHEASCHRMVLPLSRMGKPNCDR